ncbi:MAG: AEC family transporter [Eubacteriales bacterium]|nr:AEC family transporter [Eubacteriales bacterium]
MVWQAVEAVLVIFLMIGSGLFVSWRKWVSADVAKVFPKIIINITLPCMIIYSLSANFSRQQLYESWLPLTIVFAVVPVTFFIGRFFAGILKIPQTRRGVFTVLFSFSNSVFIGFPVALALFGDAGMPYALFYYLANTTFFWLLGYYVIRKDADAISGRHSGVPAAEVLKKLITPPIVTVLVMFTVILLGLKLPDLMITTAEYIGRMTSPLSLMFMGCVIYGIGIKGMGHEKGMGAVLAGRFLVIPVLCFAVCTLVISLISQGGATVDFMLMRNVFTVQISLPVMTQTVIVAEMCGADTKYATKNVVWTTLASLITIPAYMILFQYI